MHTVIHSYWADAHHTWWIKAWVNPLLKTGSGAPAKPATNGQRDKNSQRLKQKKRKEKALVRRRQPKQAQCTLSTRKWKNKAMICKTNFKVYEIGMHQYQYHACLLIFVKKTLRYQIPMRCDTL